MLTLTPEQWRIISPYLNEAIDLPPGERTIWLTKLRQENPVLAEQIASLLDEHAELVEQGFLECDVLGLPESKSLEGQTIGSYRLLSGIGHGGMGTVWLAERTDGRFERRVAFKFLNLAVVGHAERRFRREGSILGKLSHPNIAGLLDAGVSSSGQPYLVLEYVEGQPIIQYCDEHKLTIADRVKLFLDVLGAVAHAHANLIVHRDLKPSNVYVSKDGVPKLLDFGIAKLLEGEGQEQRTVITQEAGSPLTPQYAAPEQVTGGTITTATDVYALGLLLYETLTGQHPVGGDRRSAADLVKAIIETDPAKPSTAVASTTREEAAATASNRSVDSEKLRRQLRGDLDTIVAKALKKAPNERYASVGAFADDLQRYLRHEPISALSDTLIYRTSKFVRRHWTSVALASLAFLATGVGVTATLIQAKHARVQRDFALRQLSRAEAVIELDELKMDGIDPMEPILPDKLFDNAEAAIRRQQITDPPDRVEILVSLARNANIGNGDERALRLFREAYDLSHQVVDQTVRAKAACGLGGFYAHRSELSQAEGLIQEGLTQLSDEPQFVIAKVLCLSEGSKVSRANGDVQGAIHRLLEAQTTLRNSQFHSEMIDLHLDMDLADSYRQAGMNREANQAFEAAYAKINSLGREASGLGGTLSNNWGRTLLALGRPREAEKKIHRAVEIFSGSEDDPEAVPSHVTYHATALRDMGLLERAAKEAEHSYNRAVQINHPASLDQALLVRASIYRLRGEFSRASDCLAELEPRLQRRLPPGNILFAALKLEQAQVAQGTHDLPRALDLANQAVAITEAAINSGKQGADFLPKALLGRSDIERELGQTELAFADASRALRLVQDATIPGEPSSLLGQAYLTQGRALLASGKTNEASPALAAAVRNLEDALGPEHPDTVAASRLAK
jgi:serine/threonine protein kinase